MKSPWAVLYDLFSADATLAGLLGTDERGDPGIYPEFRDDLQAEGDFPLVHGIGVSAEERLDATSGDAEVSTWLHVLTSQDDPEATRDSIDNRMVALAEETLTSTRKYDGVRVSVRTAGMRDSNQPDRLRRRRIWSVGVN